MKGPFTIPLSLNRIDARSLAAILIKYDGQNPMDVVADFERSLRNTTGSAYAVGLNSGTAAIHLGLKALGVGSGDVVIAPTFTYVASVSPVLYLRAVPVLVDCDPESWNIDPVLMRTAIESCVQQGKKPKAIIAVHIYGMPAPMNEIMKIAEHYGIPVLEDAAEAIGSVYNNRQAGTLGTLGTLSFNNNKILTTYGGGAVLTNESHIAARVVYWATHSRKDKPYYEHEEVGYNYRLGALNAVAGLAGMDQLEVNIRRRRANFAHYQHSLASKPGVGWQQEPQDAHSNRWFTALTLTNGIAAVREALALQKIETRPLWKPMHQQPLFADCQAFINGTADKLYQTGLCLPSGNDLTKDEVETTCRIMMN